MGSNFPLSVTLVLVVGVTVAASSTEKLEFALLRNRRETALQKENLCPPLRILHGSVRCVFQNTAVSCDAPLKPGTRALPSCKLNYRIDRPAKSELICLANGRWDEELLECVPACGDSEKAIYEHLRITHGSETVIDFFPWHAGIYHWAKETESWEQQCGGSLITDQFVLTAAHCVYDKEKEDVRIALGKYHRSWDKYDITEQRFNVSQIFFPSNFERSSFIYDIALVQLDGKIEFGGLIMPVCHGLVEGPFSTEEQNVFMVGWGRTIEDDATSVSKTLLYNNGSKIESQTVCRSTTPNIYPTFDKFCTSNKNSVVSISQPGDSGGGLTVRHHNGVHYILGVLSFRIKQEKYSLITNVSLPTHIKWIEDNIRKYDRDFRWDEKQIIVFNYTLGDFCKRRGDLIWSCVKISDCHMAMQDMYRREIRPDSCLSTDGNVPAYPQVVCCGPVRGKSVAKCQHYERTVYVKEDIDSDMEDFDACALDTSKNAHMATIGYSSGSDIHWICSGALISERYVLSTASCYKFENVSYKARFGDTFLGDVVYYNITQTILHPKYSGQPHHFYNLALYKLEGNVKFNHKVRPICLHTGETPTGADPIHAGLQNQTDFPGPIVEKALFTFLNIGQCLKEYVNYTEYRNFSSSFLCARSLDNETKNSSWNWFEGSALQINLQKPYCMYSLVGILSRSLYDPRPGIFTGVSSHVPWIESIVWP